MAARAYTRSALWGPFSTMRAAGFAYTPYCPLCASLHVHTDPIRTSQHHVLPTGLALCSQRPSRLAVAFPFRLPGQTLPPDPCPVCMCQPQPSLQAFSYPDSMLPVCVCGGCSLCMFERCVPRVGLVCPSSSVPRTSRPPTLRKKKATHPYL